MSSASSPMSGPTSSLMSSLMSPPASGPTSSPTSGPMGLPTSGTMSLPTLSRLTSSPTPGPMSPPISGPMSGRLSSLTESRHGCLVPMQLGLAEGHCLAFLAYGLARLGVDSTKVKLKIYISYIVVTASSANRSSHLTNLTERCCPLAIWPGLVEGHCLASLAYCSRVDSKKVNLKIYIYIVVTASSANPLSRLMNLMESLLAMRLRLAEGYCLALGLGVDLKNGTL